MAEQSIYQALCRFGQVYLDFFCANFYSIILYSCDDHIWYMKEFCLLHLDFWWSDVDSFPETEACSHFWGLHSIGKFASHDAKSRKCVTQLWFIWLESFHFQLASVRFQLHLSITKANQLLQSALDMFDKRDFLHKGHTAAGSNFQLS